MHFPYSFEKIGKFFIHYDIFHNWENTWAYWNIFFFIFFLLKWVIILYNFWTALDKFWQITRGNLPLNTALHYNVYLPPKIYNIHSDAWLCRIYSQINSYFWKSTDEARINTINYYLLVSECSKYALMVHVGTKYLSDPCQQSLWKSEHLDYW